MANNDWEFTFDLVFGNDQEELILDLNTIVSHLDDKIIAIFSNKD